MHERTRLTAERGVSARSAMLKRLDEPAGRRFAGTQRHQAPRHVGGVRGGAGRAVQLSAFLTAAGRIPIYGTLFTLIAKAGLRPSEARGLKPDDIDWHTRTVRIPRSLDPDNAEKPTKTYETRDVDLSAELATTLRQYLGWLDRHALTEGWEEPHWLFPGPDNKPLDESLVRRSFRRALKRAGVRNFSTYDLRHTLRLASALPWRAAPPRQPTARSQERHDHPEVVRAVDSGDWGAMGRPTGRRDRSWNHNVEPDAKIAHPWLARRTGSARSHRWWAVKDSNVGPAD